MAWLRATIDLLHFCLVFLAKILYLSGESQLQEHELINAIKRSLG